MTLEEIMKLPVHPAAEVFPMLADDELDELADDIKENGLLHPLIIKDGVLIDGRNRREACRRRGIEPYVEEINGIDPVALIISSNIKRRNMTKQQRLIAFATIKPKPEPGKRNDLTSGNLPQVDSSNLARARVVVNWAPDLATKVLKGGWPFEKAYEDAAKRKKDSEGHDARLAALRASDPDLADKVAEEQLTLEDAEGAVESRRKRERTEREEQEKIILETFRRAIGALAAFSNDDFAAKAFEFFDRDRAKFAKQQEQLLEGLLESDEDITEAFRIGLDNLLTLIQYKEDDNGSQAQ